MANKKFVVLVVEDEPVAQEVAKALLSPHAEVLVAMCLRDALLYIEDRKDINIVILDWYVPMFRNEPARGGDTTAFLIFPIIESLPEAKMYSASSDDEANRGLEEMGCIYANKQTAPQMAIEYILSLQNS